MIDEARLVATFEAAYETGRNLSEALRAVALAVLVEDQRGRHRRATPGDRQEGPRARPGRHLQGPGRPEGECQRTASYEGRRAAGQAFYTGHARPILSPHADDVIAAVAQYAGIDPERLQKTAVGYRRWAPIRWIAFLLLSRLGCGAVAMGRRIGVDHTSVIYGLQQIEIRPDLKRQADEIWTALVERWSASEAKAA